MSKKRRLGEVDWADVRRRLTLLEDVSPQLLAARAAATLTQRAAALALVKREARSDAVELLVFDVGTERCALETRFVVEVMLLPELTRLPGAAPHTLGVIGLRGDIVPVFDLRPLRAAALEASGAGARLIVLGASDPELALLADAVQGIRHIDRAVLDASGSRARDDWGPYARAVTAEALVVLDGAALLDERGLYVAAHEAPTIREGTSP
jgi:purine-binding chemotaxis protein CheW